MRQVRGLACWGIGVLGWFWSYFGVLKLLLEVTYSPPVLRRCFGDVLHPAILHSLAHRGFLHSRVRTLRCALHIPVPVH